MRRLSLNRSEPAKKSGQNILKNLCRTTIAERIVETLAELPFIGDQVQSTKMWYRNATRASALVGTGIRGRPPAALLRLSHCMLGPGPIIPYGGQNRLALVGEESGSVGHRRQPLSV